ncbi:MAG: hypothetical protein ACI90M_003660 [Candidatus Azotimanducaceae bacterium]|jgi:hypothetical protein
MHLRSRCFLVVALSGSAGALVAQDTLAVPEQIAEFVEIHCLDCHEGESAKGQFDLATQPADRIGQLARWSRMRERVHSFEMPPVEDSEVTKDERREFREWVDGLLEREVPKLPVDPGQVTVRRLSRGQWRNTVRDLLGVAVDTSGFPADDLGYGFDSIGDALTFSTLHLEKYLAASREVARGVFHGEDPANPERRMFEAEAMRLVNDRGASMGGGGANLFTNATIEQAVEVPRDGVYQVRIVAGASQAGNEPAKMLPTLDGKRLKVIDVPNTRSKDFVVETTLTGGPHTVALSFINDYYDPKHEDSKRRDRNLRIVALEIVGPIDARPVPREQLWLQASLKGRTDLARLRSMIKTMLPALWRRPATARERDRFQSAGTARLQAGESLLAVQRFVLTAALTSPHFLFRLEESTKARVAEPLNATEFATRLSYFLWASAPDADLRALARGSKLRGSDEVTAQVSRMLQHERSESLATDFAAQWFALRALAETTPDPDRFAGFDDELRHAFRRESELLFSAILREDRDVRELLDCDFTHVNKRLATFYGLPHAGAPDQFVRTTLTGDALVRGGLLGHASMHAITSNPTRTSPVKRGKWLLDNLLGQAPPPPPPGSDSFEDEDAIDDSATLRQQMAQHREHSKCAVCHVRMDALGLAMERFDAIGRFRTEDGAGVINASGQLPDGRKLDGLVSLKLVLAQDPMFVRTMAHKLFVYAIGRDLRPVDRLRIDLEVRRLLTQDKVTVRDLILVVVRDPAFGQRISGE